MLSIISIIIFVFDDIIMYEMARPRIMGGELVIHRSLFAYQASIRNNKMPLCGGAIIDERHVLTAAHCFRMKKIEISASTLSVVVGNLHISEETVRKKVQEIFIHENYDPDYYYNDIALLRISETFHWTNEVQPIRLSKALTKSGSCIVSGWGNIYLDKRGTQWLYSVEVPIVNWTFCNQQYNKKGRSLSDKVICAGAIDKDSCQGDSGGPLVCSNTLSGIVSYGINCGRENYPGVYTEVAKYINWIEEQKQKPDSTISGKSHDKFKSALTVTKMCIFLLIFGRYLSSPNLNLLFLLFILYEFIF